jgi:hypothetical protein
MSVWENRKKTAIELEKSSQRLDCFLSVCYLFPNVLEPKDMEMLAKRETELTKIYRYGGRGFFTAYSLGVAAMCLRRGTLPYFRDMAMHSILCVGGSFCAAYMAEKIASETYYNTVLINMSDKYNFTPEEVMDLQRNLNQYYIKKDREADLEK